MVGRVGKEGREEIKEEGKREGRTGMKNLFLEDRNGQGR